MLEIPLNSNPEQLFSIVLEGVQYSCRVTLNSRSGVWSISFYDNDTCLLAGVPMVSGVDILKQHNLAIKNLFIINQDATNLDPEKTDLGTVSTLVLLNDDELAELENGATGG